MKQLTCEMCGSIDLIKQDGVFVCQSCGCKYSVEDAKKMMIEGAVEVTGTVKVDGINDAEKLYENAKVFMKLGNFAKAKTLLYEYTTLYPEDYRGWWGMLEVETNDFKEFWFSRRFDFLKYYNYSLNCCKDDTVKKHLKEKYEIWYKKRYDYLCKKKLSANTTLGWEICGTLIDEKFYKDGIENAKQCNRKIGVFGALGFSSDDKVAKKELGISDRMYTYPFSKFLFVNGCTAVIEYVTRYDKRDVTLRKSVHFRNIVNCNLTEYLSSLPDGEAKSEFASEGCYVATCVYGSYDCPQVWVLRRFRDNTLAETIFGRAFIRTYYAISPTLVKWFGNTCWFKKTWKGTLDKMVSKLQANGVEDTPYQDRIW